MENRKVRNATACEADGMSFRSRLEAAIWKRLRAAGYDPQYEPDTVELQAAFRPSHPWYMDGEPQVTKKGECVAVKALTYTPDFKVDADGVTWYIEAKGWGNDRFPLKRKLFIKAIDGDEGVVYAQVNSVRGMERLVEAMATRGRGAGESSRNHDADNQHTKDRQR